MCVSQFRDYCNASSFSHSNIEKDLEDPNLEVRKGVWPDRERYWYYVTDLNKMRKLANNNNQYAKNHLK